MLDVFTHLADWLAYSVLGFSASTKLGDAVHFFIEDVSKIYVLLVIMIYLIALVRAALNVEWVRDYLADKNKGLGYLSGSLLGAVTPFCSCSSIPVFLGFTSAGIPVGITMAFLLTSPLINEVAVLLLLSLVGWEITVMYVLIGMMTGILGGAFLDAIRAERWLQDFALKALRNARRIDHSPAQADKPTLSFKQRHQFASQEVLDIFGRVWKWVLLGVGLGAALHGVVPDGWIEQHLGEGQWWSVPVAVVLGIPLYSNATGVIPVMESLLVNGLPVGTTIAFCMSTVAASFPEFILLKQVMQWRLLGTSFVMLLVSFTLVGWLLNALAAL